MNQPFTLTTRLLAYGIVARISKRAGSVGRHVRIEASPVLQAPPSLWDGSWTTWCVKKACSLLR